MRLPHGPEGCPAHPSHCSHQTCTPAQRGVVERGVVERGVVGRGVVE